MDQGLLPRRYAKALYDVAVERGDAANLYNSMQSLAKAFADIPAMAATVANPFVSDADKTELLTAAAGAAGDATFGDFLRLLQAKRRMPITRAAALAYMDIYRRENSIYRVDISSAAPMDSTDKERLQAMIQSHIGSGTMEYHYTVDPALIGGFTVTVNSERLDASVSNRLARLRRALID